MILSYKQTQTQTQAQVMQTTDHVALSLGRLKILKIFRQKYTSFQFSWWSCDHYSAPFWGLRLPNAWS